ncbi:uncharacterized protein Z518_10133 [Rhinocladiella mackenziei CBS 650.93]|uniref:Uncharacterized protein n=1 Tax=Rhinocladiella mackenziei CBS 650.93 TaxID=1442369 RepID=A0A0D2FGF8_9EURO|nr:uncharacterized protein Z518_10133 [Rhinocladiella mackenziei CBS 650.93]KIX01067.1 hypothetical protein Z518_10133 [Rhinocladiella mackenziei CBS 650.93]
MVQRITRVRSCLRVLQADTETKTALVEPQVPMDPLVEHTIKPRLIPPVVMEFPGITTGGGSPGTGAKSSSFQYGDFNDNVNWVEITFSMGHLAPSEVWGSPTLLGLPLIPAEKYVKITYHPVRSVSEAVEKVQDEISHPVHKFSAASDPWFYLHVKEITRQSVEPVAEHIPLAAYLFRMLYKALHARDQSRNYVVQDLALPFSTKQMAKTLKPMLNVGVWGFGPRQHDEFIAKNRELERKLLELRGMKWLYVQTYDTEREFWEMFDEEWYDGRRKKYNVESLTSV